MRVKISYQIGVKRKFLDGVIRLEIRIPAYVSCAVRIEETVGPSDIDPQLAEKSQKLIAYAVLIIEI